MGSEIVLQQVEEQLAESPALLLLLAQVSPVWPALMAPGSDSSARVEEVELVGLGNMVVEALPATQLHQEAKAHIIPAILRFMVLVEFHRLTLLVDPLALFRDSRVERRRRR